MKEMPTMFHSLMMFLAPEPAPAQATPTSPPAVAPSVRRSPARGVISLRFVAGVIGNAVGFAVLLAICWMLLQLLQMVL
jgi:hypothetical protein